jgi:CrcB protein
MQPLLLVMAGGAVGAGARHLVGRAALGLFGPGFPWGTLAVNLVGGLLMGLLVGTLARTGGGEGWRLLLGTGVLGGFTTFSAFSLDAVTIAQRGEMATAALYVVASVAGAILALLGGLALARMGWGAAA